MAPSQIISHRVAALSLVEEEAVTCVATPALRAASMTVRASWMVRVSGLTHSTCLPRRIASIVITACVWSGVATRTASMFSSSLSSISR